MRGHIASTPQASTPRDSLFPDTSNHSQGILLCFSTPCLPHQLSPGFSGLTAEEKADEQAQGIL